MSNLSFFAVSSVDLSLMITVFNLTFFNKLKSVELSFLLGIKTIIAMTESGSSALTIASCRPKANILAMSPNKKVSKKLSLIWGLETISVEGFQNTDEMIEKVEAYLVKHKILKRNDKYIIIAGVPVGVSGTTNMIRIETINHES